MKVFFSDPIYLWYLLSIPLLIITHFLSLKSAKRKAMKFANFRALKRISGKKYITRNTTLLVIRVFVLLFLILALSGFEFWYFTLRNDNNYVVALDVSSSMAAKDFPPTRLEFAKERAKDFITSLSSGAKVGVISFSGVTLVDQTLTSDRDKLLASFNEIKTLKAGGTDIPGAIITATNLLLAQPDKGKVILFFTDGSSTLGNYVDNSLSQALTYAQDNNVVIHAIGIGGENAPIGYLPEHYNISSTYNHDLLLQVTNSTGGSLAEASEPEQIDDALQVILDNKENAYRKIDLSFSSLILGLLLLFIEWGLINSRYRRIA